MKSLKKFNLFGQARNLRRNELSWEWNIFNWSSLTSQQVQMWTKSYKLFQSRRTDRTDQLILLKCCSESHSHTDFIFKKIIVNLLVASGKFIFTFCCLNFGTVSKQKTMIDKTMTITLVMATKRAARELSGYSNNSQIFFWNSLLGNNLIFSSTKPSSSLMIKFHEKKRAKRINY